jgi:hypothetical protein
MKVLVITTDDTAVAIHVADLDLEWLQHTVGGYIEIFTGRPGWHGYCNEEGKLLGLPINKLATGFARELGWNDRGVDFIVGDVVFLGNGVDGEEASVPEWLLDDFSFYTGG